MERLEIRIEGRMKQHLEDWASACGLSTAEAVRQLIRERLGLQDMPESKQEAVEQLLSLGLSDVPAPEELEEEIHRAFGA